MKSWVKIIDRDNLIASYSEPCLPWVIRVVSISRKLLIHFCSAVLALLATMHIIKYDCVLTQCVVSDTGKGGGA